DDPGRGGSPGPVGGRADHPGDDGRAGLPGRSLDLGRAWGLVPGVGGPGSQGTSYESSISELSPRLMRPRRPVTAALSPMMEYSSSTSSTRALAWMMLSW